MKGAGVGAAAPGDNVYFKSIVPLHKISVSSLAPRLPPMSHLTCLVASPRAVRGIRGTGTRRQVVALGSELGRCLILGWI